MEDAEARAENPGEAPPLEVAGVGCWSMAPLNSSEMQGPGANGRNTVEETVMNETQAPAKDRAASLGAPGIAEHIFFLLVVCPVILVSCATAHVFLWNSLASSRPWDWDLRPNSLTKLFLFTTAVQTAAFLTALYRVPLWRRTAWVFFGTAGCLALLSFCAMIFDRGHLPSPEVPQRSLLFSCIGGLLGGYGAWYSFRRQEMWARIAASTEVLAAETVRPSKCVGRIVVFLCCVASAYVIVRGFPRASMQRVVADFLLHSNPALLLLNLGLIVVSVFIFRELASEPKPRKTDILDRVLALFGLLFFVFFAIAFGGVFSHSLWQ